MALNKATALKRRSHGTLLWFAISFLGIITINFLTWCLWLEDKSISAENHLIENMVCAWLWIIYCVIKSFSTFWPIRWGILLSTKSLLTYTAIAFYLCSWFFDKNHVAVNFHLSKFIEECLQLAGTVYFLTSAMVPLSCRRKTMNSPSRWIR